MAKVKKFFSDYLHFFIVGFVAILCAIFLSVGSAGEDGYITVGGKVTIDDSTKEFIDNAHEAMITYAKNAIPAKVVLENGEETLNVPTIEYIDGTEIPSDSSNIEDGQGAVHDTTTYLTYYNSVGIGTCINNAFGAQCFAIANDFWANYTGGRALSSCGTGAARGTLNCWEYNAGDEFEMIWDVTKVQPGDWVVTTGGTWGHIFMAMGYYNNGYIAGFSQNQGGGYCPMGGAATNVANIKVDNFGGAFRPKTYIVPDPEPTPPTPTPPSSGEITYSYVPGDYFSGVLVKLGLDEGNLWGESGTVKYYTQQLIEQNMLDRRGNVLVGVPFTLTVR